MADWIGTKRNDKRDGTRYDDRMSALDGDDTLYGHGGNDLLIGGQGDDVVDGRGGNDLIDSGAGGVSLRPTIDRLIAGHGSRPVRLIVAHSHGHGDHHAGDEEFRDRPDTEIVGLDPHFAFTYLVYVLIVVAVGGLGSIGGSFAAAVLIGIGDMAGKYYFPALGSFVIYLVTVAVLMWRPAGLFGRR